MIDGGRATASPTVLFTPSSSPIQPYLPHRAAALVVVQRDTRMRIGPCHNAFRED